ncbi:MAG: MTH1187 family thiamine-binding protein [Pseudomonadota bacterium]|nr:MTH1187 family thiamine-binding protein [Pseudomonadota bacterium]
MHLMIDLCVVPLGVGIWVSKYIAECEKILNDAGLETNLHAYGTNVAGDWDDVFSAVRRCHERVHDLGAPRITTTIKVGTRTDRLQTIKEKIVSVQQKLQ